eukprot:Gb_13819 [translate_table: standard]
MEEKNSEASSDQTPFLQTPSPSMEPLAVTKQDPLSEQPANQSDSPSKSVDDEAPLLSEKKRSDFPSPSERKVDSSTLQRSGNISSENLKEMEIKYAAYVRHDRYGTMGRGELSLKEKVLLILALMTLVPIRLAAGLTILVTYYLICRLCTLFSAPNREEEQEDYAHMTGIRRAIIVHSGRFLSRAMLFTLGFYWIKETHRMPDPGSPDPFGKGPVSLNRLNIPSSGVKAETESTALLVSTADSHIDLKFAYYESSSSKVELVGFNSHIYEEFGDVELDSCFSISEYSTGPHAEQQMLGPYIYLAYFVH